MLSGLASLSIIQASCSSVSKRSRSSCSSNSSLIGGGGVGRGDPGLAVSPILIEVPIPDCLLLHRLDLYMSSLSVILTDVLAYQYAALEKNLVAFCFWNLFKQLSSSQV